MTGFSLIRYSIKYAMNMEPNADFNVLQHLRQVGVVGKFVEFFGPGVAQLSIADRATIANMCPEYGATAAFFPVDEVSIKYLVQTGEWRKCNM